MGIPVLIIGKSGTGKTTSLRNCTDNADWLCIKAIAKPFPFKGKIKTVVSDDMRQIVAALPRITAKSIVIDDAGSLLTNAFMRGHRSMKGNAVFELYNDLGDGFWSIINTVLTQCAEDVIVYIIMHEETNDFGDIAPKTIGRMLNEKVCIEGMCTIALRSIKNDGHYQFMTQSEGGAVSKSPLGMFETDAIDNDLFTVDSTIREYYFGGNQDE